MRNGTKDEAVEAAMRGREMTDNDKKLRSEAEAEIEREIREGRKFSLEEAIGRMAGPGAMKGVSPVPLKQQAASEIESWLEQHLPAANGELQDVLLRGIKGSEILLAQFERPLWALAAYCRQVLESDYRLQELVREADVEWGQVHGERPFFEKKGSPPRPGDPYTFESVRKTLSGLIVQLPADD
jgi:hypothetical protein